jgi:hypothetical protein
MSALPFLGNLRLSDPTGVPVTLFRNPSSSKDGTKVQRLESAKTDAGEDPTINMPVDDFTTEEKARERLDVLLLKLSGDYMFMKESQKKTDKIEESKTFVQQWRKMICVNMNAKRRLYDIELRRLKDEIKNEHEKQLRILEAAQRPLSEVGSEPKPMGDDKNTILLRTLLKSDNKWEYIEKDRWRELNSRAEDIQKLQDDIEKRVERLRKADSWRQSVAHFVNTLKKLREYPQLSEMTEKIVDSVVAFVNNAAISSNQFYNVMLMGAAGTGKTRLASIIASIFAQLGMYVHERLVEAQAGDFIGQYLGETAAKSRKFLSQNIERVIFLDEAYALTHYDAEAERKGAGGSEDRKLDQYSDEAVNVLIPHLSENVGQMAMIVAGYEDRMKRDFLPANEGMGRRFPIRATLTNYNKEDLYKIFLKQAAISFVGKRPAREEDVIAYEGSVEVQRGTLAAVFTQDAEQLFYDVADASELPAYPKLHKLFEAQAGAMTNMAGVAASLLLATGETDLAGMVADRRAMFNIILTFIQSVFTGVDAQSKNKEADLARDQLVKALRAKKWFRTDQNGKDAWNAYPYVQCTSGKRNSNCPQPTQAFVADKFYTKDDMRPIVEDEDYLCTLERIWEPPAQAPTKQNMPSKSAGGSASSQSSVNAQALEELEVALSKDVLKIVLPLVDQDGKMVKSYKVDDLPAGYGDMVVEFTFSLKGEFPFDLSTDEERRIEKRAEVDKQAGSIPNAVKAAKARKGQIELEYLAQKRVFDHLVIKREEKAGQREVERKKRNAEFIQKNLAKAQKQLGSYIKDANEDDNSKRPRLRPVKEAEPMTMDADEPATGSRRSGRNP